MNSSVLCEWTGLGSYVSYEAVDMDFFEGAVKKMVYAGYWFSNTDKEIVR